MPEAIDSPEVNKALSLDAEMSDVVNAIFQTRAEALFAGGAGANETVPQEERNRVIAAVEKAGKTNKPKTR